MSVLLQICFVIVTMAVVAIAVATIRVMKHFRKASDEFSELAAEGRRLIHDTGEIVETFRDIAPRVRRVVERFETLGERTVSLSDALIHEVEVPVRAAVAVARGVRFGALQLIERLSQRFTGSSSTNGGFDY